MTPRTDTTSFSDYRQNLREHHERVRKSGQPLYVTSDGEADAVVLSPQAYEELSDRADLGDTLAMIGRSEADLEAGRVVDARDGLRELAKKHGLALDR